MKIEKAEKKNNHKELLPQIVDRIFSVCREDPTFQLKDEIEIVENKIQAFEQKIAKQDNLLKQSAEIKESLNNRIEVLENDNSRQQENLIELLGSE